MTPWFVRILAGIAGGALWPAPAAACDLPAGETATVASILDGETLELTDGRTVRLIGIKAPSPPLGWTGDGPWPFVTAAKAALSKLASGATVELHFDARRSDRHDHVLAQVYVVRGETKVWVEDALVGEGLARVYSFADTRACVAELLEREAEARAARRGAAFGTHGPIACRMRPMRSAWAGSRIPIKSSRVRFTRSAKGANGSM